MIIYEAKNIVNEKRYIGKTKKSLEIRKRQHINASAYIKTAFYHAIRKYGIDSFVWSALYECEDNNKLNKAERQFIKHFNSFGANGYNMTSGGEDSPMDSIETRKKLSKTVKKQYKNGRVPYFKGKKHTKESLEKMSKTKLGKTWEERLGVEKSNLAKKRISITNSGENNVSKRKEVRKKLSEKAKELWKSDIHREKFSNSRSRWWLIETPLGDKIEIKNLKKYCELNGLFAGNMVAVSKGRLKQYKGYKCQKL